MASTAQRCGRKKFARSFFRPTKRDTHSGAAQHLKNGSNCKKLPEANGLPDRVTAPVVASLQRAAQRNPDLDRFERGCMAAPAAAVGFLKGERLFNP
jgi:hypothetical protein